VLASAAAPRHRAMVAVPTPRAAAADDTTTSINHRRGPSMSEQQASLYERLGGYDGISAITEDIWANHTSNEAIKQRYADSDADKVKGLVRDMFCAGTGGPETYTGKDMLSAHRGMNISDQEFVAVIDDVLDAMAKNGAGKREQDEVLSILYSMKAEIVHV
jgi:hemoglobin